MKNNLLLWRALVDTGLSIRNNLQLFSYFALLLAVGNYVFLRLESIFSGAIFLHLAAIYVFYYLFIRVYFRKKPIFETDNFLRSIARMLIIIILAFASVMLLRIGFDILKLFAKSLSVFPDVYNFLAGIYAFLKSWPYTNVFLMILIFGILMFTIFIPFFAWISTIIGIEQSIIFSVIETKESYAKLFLIYVTFFGLIPFIFMGFLMSMKTPLIITSIISGIYSIFQIVLYLRIYLILFPLRILK